MNDHIFININENKKKNEKRKHFSIFKTKYREESFKNEILKPPHQPRSWKGVLFFLKTTIFWLMLPRLLIMEIIAIIIIVIVFKSDQNARYVAGMVSTTFNLVAGIVVGYMVTISFDVGLDKYNKTVMIFKKDILQSLINTASAIESCAYTRHKYKWKQNPPSHLDVLRVLNLLTELQELLENFPFAIKTVSIDILDAGELSSDFKLNIYTLLFSSEDIRKKIFSNENTDPIYQMLTYFMTSTYLLQELYFADTYMMLSNIQNGVCTAFNGMQSIQAMYGARIDRIYSHFIGIIIYLYVLCVPIMTYSEHYWSLVLLFYPLIVYIFLAPHIIGNMLRNNPCLNSPITMQSVDDWCQSTIEEIHYRMEGALQYIENIKEK